MGLTTKQASMQKVYLQCVHTLHGQMFDVTQTVEDMQIQEALVSL